MALVPEWERRVEIWKDRLRDYFYTELGTLNLRGFTTMRQLTSAEALRGRFRPMPEGTRWGRHWEYGWFRASVTLPPSAQGRRIVILPAHDGEFLATVNGKHVGCGFTGNDWDRRFITLTRSGRRGERFDLLLEAYGGHGAGWDVLPRGPEPRGGIRKSDPRLPQRTVGRTTYGAWEEDVYQLWLDVASLWDVRSRLAPASLRHAEICRGLRDFSAIVDFELPHAGFLASVAAARRRLRPLLEARNGSTAPVFHAVGHAHLDVAWLWPLQETERKIARTFANQLSLAAEYPEYRFLQSEPHVYLMLKERYPDLYARVRQAIRRGKVVADGGMWVEADTNLSGGESLIRQFIHGKRFFRGEFGVDSRLLWLPDVFGYSAAVPQIMKGCGVDWFATSKITWAYNGGERFPYNTFRWIGIDGTAVLAQVYNDYNTTTNPGQVMKLWDERIQQDGPPLMLMPFGWGDGGGGPTRDHLEFVRRERDLEGVPRVRMTPPSDFFRAVEARGEKLESYVGELYFQAHRGTYTSQARTKRGNRTCEFALREAEAWGALAAALHGRPSPAAALAGAWRIVLLNQFHDIIPGSSIRRVYVEAEAMYAKAWKEAESEARSAAKALAGRGDALAVFNSFSWDREGAVELPGGWRGAEDADGNPLPVQRAEGKLWTHVRAPSCGWTTITRSAKKAAPRPRVRAEKGILENELLQVRVNALGEVSSVLDKETGRRLSRGPCNELRMFRDVPSDFDAWDVDRTYRSTPVRISGKAAVRPLSSGPLFGAIRVERMVCNSRLTQDIILRAGSRTVEFWSEMDWRERHKLLKVAFTGDIRAEEALHEIQFGHVRRPNHLSRTYDADRYEVPAHKWSALAEEGRGFAVLNNAKYGVDALGGTISLSLLRSPLSPDEKADQGRQVFSYALHLWNGALTESRLVQAGYELQRGLLAMPRAARGTMSMLSVDRPNVVVETVKPAEDGSGDVVVRLYESMRTATRCTLSTPLPVRRAFTTDMLERNRKDIHMAGGKLQLDFRGFEVKTIRLKISRTGK